LKNDPGPAQILVDQGGHTRLEKVRRTVDIQLVKLGPQPHRIFMPLEQQIPHLIQKSRSLRAKPGAKVLDVKLSGFAVRLVVHAFIGSSECGGVAKFG
jgi:hypothetical protein